MNSTLISASSILLTSYIGSMFTRKNVTTDWYNCIKPSITPPKYVFPVVWIILYILLFFVFKNILDSRNKQIIILFSINLLLNILWTYVYFSQKDVNTSFLVILLILITSIVILFKTKNKLYVPYVLWIGFASYLNYLSIDKIQLCK
jgi:tryptophan-rich sensory protein